MGWLCLQYIAGALWDVCVYSILVVHCGMVVFTVYCWCIVGWLCLQYIAGALWDGCVYSISLVHCGMVVFTVRSNYYQSSKVNGITDQLSRAAVLLRQIFQ